MELSAFAHLTRRNVKVIQPGLVYVIEWAAGSDPADLIPPSSSSSGPTSSMPSDQRRSRRTGKHSEKDRVNALREAEDDGEAGEDEDDDDDGQGDTVYVAYVLLDILPCLRHSTVPKLSRLGTLFIHPQRKWPTRWAAKRA